jgi:hypothetical protein
MKRSLRIEEMNERQLLAFDPSDMRRALTTAEVVHMAGELEASWFYDYEALEAGRPGRHAILKSGKHSDGFFVSRMLLAADNIRRLIVAQMAMLLKVVIIKEGDSNRPTHVVGVPNGAVVLGEGIGDLLDLEVIEMTKGADESFQVEKAIDPNALLLVVEDICTTGKGFRLAVQALHAVQPAARIFPYDPVIINRGGLEKVTVSGIGEFSVLPLADKRINDWEPGECPLCARGSKPIKPKATDENWKLITTSQLA